MKLELSKEVMSSLPEPASDGLVRVTVGLKVGSDGSVDLSEVNDMPVAADSDKEPTDEEETAGAEGEDGGAPDLSAMAADIYGPSK